MRSRSSVIAECEELLRDNTFGRLAFVVNDFPVVLPVNYRLVEASGKTWVALRTRPGNVFEHEQDEGRVPDRRHRSRSVARAGRCSCAGRLHHVNPTPPAFVNASIPSHGSWPTATRGSIIEPFAITGRRLHPQNRSGHSTRAYL